MAITLGSTSINKLYLGDTGIKKVYLGDELIFSLYPDFSGLNMTDMWSLFKTSESAYDYFMIINRTDGTVDVRVVWFDSEGKFSDDSPVGTYDNSDTVAQQPDPTTTIGAIKSDDWSMIGLWSQIQKKRILVNNTTTNVTHYPVIESGEIITNPDNGQPAVLMSSVQEARFNTDQYDELDSGNDWSVLSIVSPDISDSTDRYGLWASAAYQSTSYFNAYVDMRSNNIAFYTVKDSVGVTGNYTNRQNTTGLKRILTTGNSSKVYNQYVDNSLEATASTDVSTDYTNDTWRMFGVTNFTIDRLEGYWQGYTIHDAELTSTQRTNLDAAVLSVLEDVTTPPVVPAGSILTYTLTDGGEGSSFGGPSAGTQTLTQDSTTGSGTGVEWTGTYDDGFGADEITSIDSLVLAGSGYVVNEVVTVTSTSGNWSSLPTITINSVST
jgi:hypothetical protein